MKKKAQAALEFLTTYGWAILVIIVMIGALAYYGVINPKRMIRENCMMGDILNPLDYILYSNGALYLNTSLLLTEGISSLNYTCTYPDGSTFSDRFDGPISEGETLTFYCDGPDLKEGDIVKIKINYTYITLEGIYPHRDEGEVFARVIKTPPTPPPPCFPPERSVLMGDGTYKPISLIRKGDVVKAYEKGVLKDVKVIEVKKHRLGLYRFIDINNGEIVATPNHKFLTPNGEYKSLEEFSIGDEILFLDGKKTIFSKEEFYRYTYVYDLSVEAPHNYIVGDLIGHNRGPAQKQ